MLDVGTNCPYYESGDYTKANLVFNAAGNVHTIVGPNGELYKKTNDSVEKPNPREGRFQPNYLGGTLKFDVNVSDVGCNCAAGVFLVALDGEKCNTGEYESDSPPECNTIDIMKAN